MSQPERKRRTVSSDKTRIRNNQHIKQHAIKPRLTRSVGIGRVGDRNEDAEGLHFHLKRLRQAAQRPLGSAVGCVSVDRHLSHRGHYFFVSHQYGVMNVRKYYLCHLRCYKYNSTRLFCFHASQNSSSRIHRSQNVDLFNEYFGT